MCLLESCNRYCQLWKYTSYDIRKKSFVITNANILNKHGEIIKWWSNSWQMISALLLHTCHSGVIVLIGAGIVVYNVHMMISIFICLLYVCHCQMVSAKHVQWAPRHPRWRTVYYQLFLGNIVNTEECYLTSRLNSIVVKMLHVCLQVTGWAKAAQRHWMVGEKWHAPATTSQILPCSCHNEVQSARYKKSMLGIGMGKVHFLELCLINVRYRFGKGALLGVVFNQC